MLSASSFRELLDAPLTELMPAAAARRDARTGRRITFSPKVFVPLTMLCRDRCGYCTFAKPPARLDTPYLDADQVLELASRGAALGCFEALFTLGEAPEERYPQAAAWLHEHGFATTVDYLAAVAKRVLDETGLLPHANAGALSEAELLRLRAVSPSQGMMIETLADRLHEPGGAHFGAPDKTAGPPPRHAARGRPRPRAVHHRHPRRYRRDARRTHRRAGRDRERAPRARPRAGSDRAELPAEARHRDAPRRTVPDRRVPLVDRRGPPDPARRRPPAGAAEPERRSHAAARGRHRRLGRRVAAHDRSRESRAAVARARPAPRARPKPRASCSRRASPCIPSTCSGPTSGCTPTCAPRCSSPPTSKASRATPRGRPGRDDLEPPTLLPPPRARPPVARSARCSRVCSPARRSASTRSSRCSARAAPRSRASPRSPTNSAGRSSATRSRSSAIATSTTRTCARSSAGSARSRRARSRSTCGASRISSRWRRCSAASSRRSSAARPRCASRAGSTPTSTATTTSTSPGP